MSVLIRGMEMPKSCDECSLYTCMHNHDNCPLAPVPAHGRLIDADELLQSHSVSDGIYFPDAYIPATAIKAAPTIIPAEPAEEEMK